MCQCGVNEQILFFQGFRQRTAWSRFFFLDFCIVHFLGVWGIERSGFFNGREKWAKGFENQRV